MLNFKNLVKIDNENILECFNHSFSDYSIPLKLTLDQLETKLRTENINKEISVGAFKENKLVGFVLHGARLENNCRVTYNAGTGVRPSERGQKLTRKMYEFIIPVLKKEKIKKVVLEVISNNIPAIKSYQSIGFKTVRYLSCFKGTLIHKKINTEIKIETDNTVDIDILSKMGEIKPSWQNANKTIQNLGSDVQYIIAYYQEEICGYCIVNVKSNRILQIVVKQDLRGKHIGSTMLNYIRETISSTVSIINVDSMALATIEFFKNRNFSLSLTQKEMNLMLDP